MAVVASRAGLSMSLSVTDSGPRSFTLSALKIDAGPFIQELSKHFKVMFLNAQSVRSKALDICDYIMQANVNLVFLCETWLRPVGDEADCAALTPPGFCLKSLPRQSGTGGGLAVLHQTSLTKTLENLFLRLSRYVKCVFPMMVTLQCSLVFTIPHLVDIKS